MFDKIWTQIDNETKEAKNLGKTIDGKEFAVKMFSLGLIVGDFDR